MITIILAEDILRKTRRRRRRWLAAKECSDNAVLRRIDQPEKEKAAEAAYPYQPPT